MEPVNLLSLDGGGVRGISEVVILHELMRRVQVSCNLPSLPKPCDYFHMIGGTSTGGLVAIMLGRMRMSTTEALEAYRTCASTIFATSNRRIVRRFGPKVLEREVKAMVARKCVNEKMRDLERRADQRGHSFVCAVQTKATSIPVLFRSYEPPNSTPDDLTPAEVEASQCFIWQAARATTAAPTFFVRMTIKGIDFVDGALAVNNPAHNVLSEASSYFGNGRELGCLLSLGTGLQAETSLETTGGLVFCLLGVGISDLIKAMKTSMTDTERPHKELLKRFIKFPRSYSRFNVDGEAKSIKLHEHQKMEMLVQLTQAYLRRPEVSSRLDEVAETLAKGLTDRVTLGQASGIEPNMNPPAFQSHIVSEFFAGRDDILSQLRLYFSRRNESKQKPRREFMLGGMGGVGKTQIALKFGQESKDQFPGGVYWIDGTSQATIQQSYRLIAIEQFGLPSEQASIENVLRLLDECTKDWLILFDNRWEKSVDEYLPRGRTGNVLYTTRYSGLKAGLPNTSYADVDVMSEDTSVSLLLNVAGWDSENRRISSRSAREIVNKLGYLPLGIDIFGKHMRVTGFDDLDVYVEELRCKWDELRISSHGFHDRSAAIQGICTSFDISYSHLHFIASSREEKPTRSTAAKLAIALLDIMCFYHNTGFLEETVERVAIIRLDKRQKNVPVRDIPHIESLLATVDQRSSSSHSKVSKCQPLDTYDHRWDSLPFRNAIAMLSGLSFVRPDVVGKQSYGMHVLLHEWMRERMPEQRRWEKQLEARSFLSESIAKESLKNMEQAYRMKIVPHIIACRFSDGHLGPPNAENNAIEALQDEAFSNALQSAIMFREALDLQKHVIRLVRTYHCIEKERAFVERVTRKMHLIYLVMATPSICENELAEEAIESFRCCICEFARDYGRASKKTLNKISALGRLYAMLGMEKESLAMYEKATEIAEETYGVESEEALAIKYRFCAARLRRTKPVDLGVLNMLTHVVEAQRRKLGEIHDDYLQSLSLQNSCFCWLSDSDLGDNDKLEALQTLKYIFLVRSMLKGPADFQTLISLTEYGQACVDTKLYKEADEVWTQAEKMSTKFYGPYNLITMSAKVKRAEILAVQGINKGDEALELLREEREKMRREMNGNNILGEMMERLG